MISPRGEFAGRIHAAFQIVKTDGAVVVVMKIVFARPEKFDRRANFLRDGGRFDHVVVGEAAAEATSGAAKMDGDVCRGNLQDVGDKLAATFGSLAGRPD